MARRSVTRARAGAASPPRTTATSSTAPAEGRNIVCTTTAPTATRAATSGGVTVLGSRSRIVSTSSTSLRRPSPRCSPAVRAGPRRTSARHSRSRSRVATRNAASCVTRRSRYRRPARARPNVRTPTTRVVRVRIGGCCAARAISQPEVAVSATPDSRASAPNSTPRTSPRSVSHRSGNGRRAGSPVRRRSVSPLSTVSSVITPAVTRLSTVVGMVVEPPGTADVSETAVSSRGCAAARTAAPDRSAARTAVHTRSALAGSRCAVGSSSSSSHAPRRTRSRARATARRCRWPADSSRTGRSANPSRPTSASTAPMSAPTSGSTSGPVPGSPSGSSGSSPVVARPGTASASSARTLPPAKAGDCGTQATLSRHVDMSMSSIGTPSTVTVPDAGVAKPSRTASVVVFPAPLGASSHVVCPGRTVRVNPSGAYPPRRATRRSRRWIAPRPGTRAPGRGSGSSRTAATRRTASTPSSLAWKAAPTERSGW